MAIQFFQEDIEFKLKNTLKIKKWIKSVVQNEKKSILELNFIFCNDEYLHKINVEYLEHDTYTDIITFDNSEEKGKIESDIFISIERVKENAFKLKVTFEQELHRVIIHGVLHLLGYKDKTKADKQTMRAKEDEALSMLVL